MAREDMGWVGYSIGGVKWIALKRRSQTKTNPGPVKIIVHTIYWQK